MTAPNIASPNTITGTTAVLAVTTTATAIITNSSGSNTVCKVNSLIVANINGSTAATVNVDVYRSSTAYPIAYQISIPAGASLDILNRYVYLQEGDTLRCTASVNSYLTAVASYEVIS